VAPDAVENHVDPATVRSNTVVLSYTTLAASYPDIPASEVCVTLVLPVHATESDKAGEELNDVGCVMLAV
jgi:hypothetical protein